MSVKGDHPVFEPLPMRRRHFAQADSGQYHVRTSSGEIKEIKADTAYEAVIKSGEADIIKIERLFNSRQSLLDQSKFADDSPAAQEATPQETIQERINRRKNPIISAGELDELMRAARAYADAPPPSSPETEIMAPPDMPAHPSSSGGASLAMGPPPVPVLDEPLPTGEGVSAVGLDVHGDGFDEIIPAAPQPKPAKPQPQEGKPAPQAESEPAAAVQAAPEKELSPEEVEKLLQGRQE